MDNKITLEHIEHAKSPKGEKGNQTLERMNSSHEELTNWALSFLPDIALNKILDIGCGGGATIRRLVDRFDNAFVNGIDYSATSVEKSREFNATILGEKCDVTQGDVHKLPYDESTFDLITAFETVYFWGDIDSAFSQVNSRLADNGVFLICCEMSDDKNPRWGNVLDEMHIFDIPTWKDCLVKNNFNVISSHELHDEWICLIATKI